MSLVDFRPEAVWRSVVTVDGRLSMVWLARHWPALWDPVSGPRRGYAFEARRSAIVRRLHSSYLM